MKRSTAVRYAASVGLAMLTVLALGLDMTVETPKALILEMRDGGLFVTLDNFLITVRGFYQMDHLVGLALALGLTALYVKLLFRSSRRMGERLLSIFFAAAMLVSEAVSTEESIQCLWSTKTQVLKALFYLAGLYPFFLTCVRMVKLALDKAEGSRAFKSDSLWAGHPFVMPAVIMLLCWAPFLVMKYPGSMSPDVTMQLLGYLNGSLDASHPLFSTLCYGIFYDLGRLLGNPNIGIFLFTLLQSLGMLLVLSYSCLIMRRYQVPAICCAAILAAYCIVPNYSGWITCLVKDVPYTIGCILLCVLLLDFSLDASFCKKKRNAVFLAAAWLTIWLWRKNGFVMVVLSALYMLVFELKRRRTGARFLAATVTGVVVCSCAINGLIPYLGWSVTPSAQREIYSTLLQMTGRIVVLHDEELSESEKAILGEVVDYDRIAERYWPAITDGQKGLFRETASAEAKSAYRRLAWEYVKRYPVDALDSYLNVVYRLFDIRSDRVGHVNGREMLHPYYLRSYTNELYRQESLHGLDAAQEAVENFDYLFVDIPVVGWLVNIGVCVDFLLMMAYWAHRAKRGAAIAALLPAIVTAIFCLFSPLVYIRYALPITATLPMWIVGYLAHRQQNGQTKEVEAPCVQKG